MHGRSTDVARATFDARPESVREARRFVLDALGDEADVSGDAVLLTSELATNAVIHARTLFVVTVRRVGSSVRVDVQDGSTIAAHRCRYSATSGTGRGLGMVEDVADAWGVEEVTDGKRVWFTLTVGRRAGGDDEVATMPTGSDGEPDLDEILADFGGRGDEGTDDVALRWAA